MDDDFQRAVNCFTRGCAPLTGDSRKWHRHRKYRAPRFDRRPPTGADENSRPRALLLLHRPLQGLFGLHFELLRGMKPGMPVFTTSLSLCLVRMRLISSIASSGRGEMLKFSLARDR